MTQQPTTLAQALELVAAQQVSGRLSVQAGPHQGAVFFSDSGHVVAVHLSDHQPNLGRRLVSGGNLSEHDYADLATTVDPSSPRLVELAVEAGTVPGDVVVAVTREIALARLACLMESSRIQVTFTPGKTTRDWLIPPVTVAKLLHGHQRRQADSQERWARLAGHLSPEQTWVRPLTPAEDIEAAEAGAVLAAALPQATVAQVAQACGFTLVEAVYVLEALRDGGHIDVGPAPDSAPDPEPVVEPGTEPEPATPDSAAEGVVEAEAEPALDASRDAGLAPDLAPDLALEGSDDDITELAIPDDIETSHETETVTAAPDTEPALTPDGTEGATQVDDSEPESAPSSALGTELLTGPTLDAPDPEEPASQMPAEEAPTGPEGAASDGEDTVFEAEEPLDEHGDFAAAPTTEPVSELAPAMHEEHPDHEPHYAPDVLAAVAAATEAPESSVFVPPTRGQVSGYVPISNQSTVADSEPLTPQTSTLQSLPKFPPLPAISTVTGPPAAPAPTPHAPHDEYRSALAALDESLAAQVASLEATRAALARIHATLDHHAPQPHGAA